MSNRVHRAQGIARSRGRSQPWLAFVGITALLAAGCGGSVEGVVGTRGSAATGSSGAGTSASNAPVASAMATSLASSAPPFYPPVVGNSPPPLDPGPPPQAPPEPPRPTTPAPALVVVAPNDCRFEYLGDWVRCENAGWPNVTVSSAPDLVGCMQECLQHDDCSAVTDYFWLGIPDLGCYLYTSSCDAPVNHPAWAEEDGGRDYRRAACAAPDAGH